MDLRRSRVRFLANDVKAKADVLCARVPQRTPRPALGWKMLPALPKRLEIESKQLHDPIKLNSVSFARTFKLGTVLQGRLRLHAEVSSRIHQSLNPAGLFSFFLLG